MSTYVARFTVKLKRTINSNEAEFPKLVITTQDKYLTELTIQPRSSGNIIDALFVEATYSGDKLGRMLAAGGTEADGICLSVEGGPVMLGGILPWEVVRYYISPILYQLSGFTLQADIFWDIEDDLPTCVEGFHWTLPDGRKVPRLPMSYPMKGLLNLTDAGITELTLQNWATLQDCLSGHSLGAPLWRLVLADAHRERKNDIRKVVLGCATALDVGAQTRLPTKTPFGLAFLKGENTNGVRLPDLHNHDADLFSTLSLLWNTRHGVVHHGRADLYDASPLKGAKPLRRLAARDVESFLTAVPKGIAFIETHLPVHPDHLSSDPQSL